MTVFKQIVLQYNWSNIVNILLNANGPLLL